MIYTLNHYIWVGLLFSKSYSIQQQSAEAGLQLHSIQGLLALVCHSLHYSLLSHNWCLAFLIAHSCRNVFSDPCKSLSL